MCIRDSFFKSLEENLPYEYKLCNQSNIKKNACQIPVNTAFRKLFSHNFSEERIVKFLNALFNINELLPGSYYLTIETNNKILLHERFIKI